VILVGSQAMLAPADSEPFAEALSALGAPVYLSGMARGLLGANHPLQLRHQRKQALREADLVVLAGVPCDFRLDYGRHIAPSAALVALNRSDTDLRKNRRPDVAIKADPDLVLLDVAQRIGQHARKRGSSLDRWGAWLTTLQSRDAERERDIETRAAQDTPPINPLALFRTLDAMLPDNAVLVADGGDFVATASYIVRPRRPLSWLDPGVFGTRGGLDHLRRRRRRLQPDRVRHVRSASPAGDRDCRQRCVVGADRA
jgi:acetolactate synthase-1/2/3 large subunit